MARYRKGRYSGGNRGKSYGARNRSRRSGFRTRVSRGGFGGRGRQQTVRLVIQQQPQQGQFYVPGMGLPGSGVPQAPIGFTPEGGLAIATGKPQPRRARF